MNEKRDKILGILGGMGTNAGLNFVKRFLNEWESSFVVNKEWDYPHFILDSNCKLPSRVRHILYKEESPLEGMISSIQNLKKSGADLVVIPCNTAHYFIDEVKKSVDIEIVNMIQLVLDYLKTLKIKKIYVLASEGTVMANLYDKYKKEILVEYSENNTLTRNVIEDVKKNIISKVTINNFIKLLKKDCCNVLACTEFSLLYSENQKLFKKYKIIDPEITTIKYLIKRIVNNN
jgi:aspartate racemase